MVRPEKKFVVLGIALIAIGATGVFFLCKERTHPPEPEVVLTPPNSLTAGITFQNASTSDIVVELPFPGAVVGKTFSIIGKARGTWYFEASFPAELIDKNGRTLWVGPVTAEGDWMTTDFVPFKTEVTVSDQTYIGPATLILKRDNPSGESVRDGSIAFPITVEY